MTEMESIPKFKKTTLSLTTSGTKKRMWKSLKQILATERTLQWGENAVTCLYTLLSYSISTIINKF